MNNAKIIVDIIRNTSTEKRGNLFLDISKELKKRDQYFTSALFLLIAHKYGFK